VRHHHFYMNGFLAGSDAAKPASAPPPTPDTLATSAPTSDAGPETTPEQPYEMPAPQTLSYHRALPLTGKPEKIIILLHGMSHSAAAMMRLARGVIREEEPQAVIYALNAPFFADPKQHPLAVKLHPRQDELRKVQNSRVWYELPKSRRNPRPELREPLSVGISHLHEMINLAKREHGLQEKDVHLLAFSQGCAPAFQVALERPDLAAVALLCGSTYDPELFGKGNITPTTAPIFYAAINQDDTVPGLLQEHTKFVMRRLKLPVTLHTTPAAAASHNQADGSLLRSVQYNKPTQLRFSLTHLHPKKLDKPLGPHDLFNPRSLIRRGDDGFGNLMVTGIEIQPQASSHWVNPAIGQALRIWHHHRLVLPEFGMTHLQDEHVARISIGLFERLWALKPVRLDANKPAPAPVWHQPHQTFGSLAGRALHHLKDGATRAMWLISRPLHRFFTLLPEPAERLLSQSLPQTSRSSRTRWSPEQRERVRIALEHLRKMEKADADQPTPPKSAPTAPAHWPEDKKQRFLHGLRHLRALD